MPAPKGNDYAKGNKGGARPTDYKPEYAKIAYSMCLLGATDAELADCFDVTEQTICNWKNKHEDFFSALKKGKVLADADVARTLYSKAVGYYDPENTYHPPDTIACIFWLKNRKKALWRDKPEEQQQAAAMSPQIPVIEVRLASIPTASSEETIID